MSKIEEASYSRIYRHTKDDSTFAIIGSEDKDTKENRYKELKSLVGRLMVIRPNIGYNKINGTYTYKLTGETTFEKGLMIYNISKEDAISIASKLNQESIIWKDKDFFGIIELDGDVIEEFSNSGMDFKKAKSAGFGTRLQSDDTNPGTSSGFVFEGSRVRMRNKNLSLNILKEVKSEKAEPLYKSVRVEKNLSKAILEATDEEYEAYMAQEKEAADRHYKTLCDEITEERRNKFNDLKALTDEDEYWEKELVDGFWIPKAFLYAISGSGSGHHLNPYMDLTDTNVYFLVYENDTIEDALKSLFDEYKADSAYSWGDNFLYALDKANPNAWQEFQDEQRMEEELENDEEEEDDE